MTAALGIASIWGQVTPLGTLRGRLTVDDKIKAIVPDKILLYGTNQQDMHTWIAEKNEVFTERGRGAGLWSISAPQLNLCAGGVEAKLPVNSNAEPSGNAPARKIMLKPCGPAFGFALRRPRFRFVRAQFFPEGISPAAELTGAVSDQHGGLSGARVGWYGRQEDRGIRLIDSVRTGPDGSFDLKRKTVASYESYLLIVSHPNYAPAVLSAGANGRIAGETRDQIGTLILKSLSGSAPGAPDVVQAEPMHRYVFRGTLLNQLPLRGFRSFDDVALLLPGVAPAPQTGHSAGAGIAPGIGTAGSFSVNGLPARQNDFNVDGSDNNDEEVGARRQGYVSLTPQSTQSIEELQIVTALPDVRLGRGAAGHINALTSGGRLGFHLDSYGFLSDARLNARDFFETRPEPSTGFTPSHARYPFTRGQAGVVTGGTVPGIE